MTSAPLITPRGESGFLFTFQDVTELKKRDREARVQQRLAAVGEMAAGIAHEIRNPLASMAGSIQILRDELPLTPDQSQLMDIVLRESDRLNEHHPQLPVVRQAAADGGRGPRRPADPDRHGAPAREQRRGDRGALDRRGRARRAGRLPRRRSADPADRLEPGDQRPARDARTAGSCGSGCRPTPGAGGRRAEVIVGVDDEGVGHRARGHRRHLPAVPRRVRQRHRPRPVHRPPRSRATTAARSGWPRSREKARAWRWRCPWARPDTAYQWAVADGPRRNA